jgi:hypothetical protein
LQISKKAGAAWWNINGAGCGGTNVSFQDGGGRAINSLSKLETLTQVGQKKTHLHLNTNTWFDPGAAQGKLLKPNASCSEVASWVGKSKYRVFRDVACASPNKPVNFCALPENQLFQANGQPTPVYASMSGDGGCSTVPGTATRERLFWDKLKVKYGVEKAPILGKVKVFFDAITIDVGVDQQRVINPFLAEATVQMWNLAAYNYVAIGGPAITVTGTNGKPVFNLGTYSGFLYGWYKPIALDLSHPTTLKTFSQWVDSYKGLACSTNPDAKAALDPTGRGAAEATDGALRNLFDQLAGAPYHEGSDIICTERGVCWIPMAADPLKGNVLALARTIYTSNPNDHGTPLIKQFILKLVKGQ